MNIYICVYIYTHLVLSDLQALKRVFGRVWLDSVEGEADVVVDARNLVRSGAGADLVG